MRPCGDALTKRPLAPHIEYRTQKESKLSRAPRITAKPWFAAENRAPQVRQLLNRSHRQALARIATIVEIRRDARPLFLAGDAAEYVYSVDEGVVRVVAEGAGGERLVVAFMFPGDMVGLAEGGYFINSAEPVTSCRLYRYPLKALERLLEQDPLLERQFLLKALHELRVSRRSLGIITRKGTCQRLISFLALLMEHEELYDRHTRQLRIPMTRFDIADFLASAPETLARCLRRLEDCNKIRRIGPRQLEIIDIGFVREWARTL